MLIELVPGEYPVGHPVQLPARVGEVPVLEAGIQPLGKTDQLGDGVVLQGGRHIDVVARLYAAHERYGLPPREILQVKDGPDVHGHRPVVAVEMGYLQHRLLPAARGDDPLSEAFAHPLKQVLEAAAPVPPLGLETSLTQGVLHRLGGGGHARLLVTEQIDVVGGPVDDPVRDQGVPARQRESVPGLLPGECVNALQTMRKRYPKSWTRYGFVEAFRPTGKDGEDWYDPDVIAPDLGMITLMAENLRAGSVWKAFMKNENIRHAMREAGFVPDAVHARAVV